MRFNLPKAPRAGRARKPTFGVQSIVTLLVISILNPLLATHLQMRVVNEFYNARMLVPNGSGSREAEVDLHFEERELLVCSRNSGSEVKRLRYSEIDSADYSYTKHPRWRSGTILAGAVGMFAIPVFFIKGNKHWLTIRTQTDFAVLRLDKVNFRIVLAAFEARASRRVQRVGNK
jgi:hypothetical protein